jgi:hypothetical protein
MIDLNVEFEKPFGPKILITKCPEEIFKKINDYVDEVESNIELKKFVSSKYGNIPNLLARDLENIYMTESKCNEIGLKDLLESLGNCYMDHAACYGEFDHSEKVKLAIISNDHEFVYANEELYSDCWVNRYYKGDYTPLHKHGSDLAGIIFLKVPEEIKKMNNFNDENIYDNKLHGRLQFVYGQDSTFCPNTWTPDQEDGIIMVFPNWLNHLVYAQKTNEERRTLSFNLISEFEYNVRLQEILGD